VRPPNGVDADLAHPEAAHLARRDQLGDGPGGLLDGDVRIEAVLVQQVEALDAEASEGPVDDLTDAFRTRVQPLQPVVHVEAELGRDLHVTLEGLQHLADERLVGVRVVDLRRVEEGDAGVQGGADDRAGVLEGVQRHAAEADVRNLKAGASEEALVHAVSSR